MINETTEGQEAGEQREELFFKVITLKPHFLRNRSIPRVCRIS